MKKTKIKKDLSNKIKEIGSGSKIRGITLISLVITIVVLVILAVVTISLTVGNDGLIDRAIKAASGYNNAQERDKQSINDIYGQLVVAADGTLENFTLDDLDKIIEQKTGSLKDRITQLENTNMYSTEEQVVGKWTDGRPIYQKTLTGSTTKESVLNIEHNIANVDKCINVLGYVTQGEYNIPTGFYNGSIYFSAFATQTKLCLRYSSAYGNSPYSITIQYIKTTD